MRSIRVLLGSVGLFASLAMASACGQANAAAADQEWIEVTPGTVAAGSIVAFRANCVDNTVPASASSSAFGTITMKPFNGTLTGEVEVPAQTKEGGFTVTLTCRNGATATATMWVVNKASAQPTASMGPHTGGGYLANRDRGLRAGDIWLLGGVLVLVAAGVVSVVTVRRQRRGIPR